MRSQEGGGGATTPEGEAPPTTRTRGTTPHVVTDMDRHAAHPRTPAGTALLELAWGLALLAWAAVLAPLTRARNAARNLRPCPRERHGYQCHAYYPRGCDACGRKDPT